MVSTNGKPSPILFVIVAASAAAENRIRASLAEHLITVERAVPDAGQKEQLLLAVKAFKGHSRSRAATLLAKRLVELQETGDATLNDLVQRLKAQ